MTTGTAQFIKIKTDGKVLDIAIQQYEVGLYICIYENSRMVEQFGSQLSQEKFIKSLQDNDKIEILE